MTVIDVQVNPAVLGWPAIKEAALAAEAAGFGAFHVFDHLAGLPLEGTDMIECFALLGALSEATTTIELGTMVVNVWNRQVGALVTAAASITALSGRQFHFGIGAGAAPASRWAAEQRAVDADLESDMERRHARVGQVLELAARQWSNDREVEFASFPLPSPVPVTIVGVNSVALSRIAGRSADGINVPWRHPRRAELLEAADEEAAGRPFIRTAFHVYEADLLDPSHPTRLEMDDAKIDRLVLAEFGTPNFPASV